MFSVEGHSEAKDVSKWISLRVNVLSEGHEGRQHLLQHRVVVELEQQRRQRLVPQRRGVEVGNDLTAHKRAHCTQSVAQSDGAQSTKSRVQRTECKGHSA